MRVRAPAWHLEERLSNCQTEGSDSESWVSPLRAHTPTVVYLPDAESEREGE